MQSENPLVVRTLSQENFICLLRLGTSDDFEPLLRQQMLETTVAHLDGEQKRIRSEALKQIVRKLGIFCGKLSKTSL
jgi:hypothetical protein